MQKDSIILYSILSLYFLIACLVARQVEIQFRPFSQLKCKLGFHKREIRQYRCVYCKKPKKHPHLKYVEGGKKDLGIKFRQ